MKELYEKIAKVQSELKAPKSQYNNYGNFSYRSAEDILTALKPLLKKYKLLLRISDEIILVGDRYYIKATAQISDYESEHENEFAVTGLAREPLSKKGMDESQITGTASSYARKYALNGMFNIDDIKDADSNEYTAKTAKKAINSLDAGYSQYYDTKKSPVSEKQKNLIRMLAKKQGVADEAIEDRIKQLKDSSEASGAINRLKELSESV